MGICPTKESQYNQGKIANSVRFFHKFDPIPSNYWSFATWSHDPIIEEAIMLYDTPGCDSAGKSGYVERFASRKATDWHEDTYNPDLSELYSFLCDGNGVSTHVVSMPTHYYAYANAFNPDPCAEVFLSLYYKFMQNQIPFWTNNHLDIISRPFESYEQCATSYVATLSAYYATYVGSYLFESRGLIDSDGMTDDLLSKDGIIPALVFLTNWGMMWVHGTYPNYELNGAYAPWVNAGFVGNG